MRSLIFRFLQVVCSVVAFLSVCPLSFSKNFLEHAPFWSSLKVLRVPPSFSCSPNTRRGIECVPTPARPLCLRQSYCGPFPLSRALIMRLPGRFSLPFERVGKEASENCFFFLSSRPPPFFSSWVYNRLFLFYRPSRFLPSFYRFPFFSVLVSEEGKTLPEVPSSVFFPRRSAFSSFIFPPPLFCLVSFRVLILIGPS